MTNSLQSSAEMQTNRTQGISSTTGKYFAEGCVPFTPPATHDPRKRTEVKQHKGAAVKLKIQETELVDINGKTVPIDDRYLDLE